MTAFTTPNLVHPLEVPNFDYSAEITDDDEHAGKVIAI